MNQRVLVFLLSVAVAVGCGGDLQGVDAGGHTSLDSGRDATTTTLPDAAIMDGCASAEVALSGGPLLGGVSDESIKVWARTAVERSIELQFWPKGLSAEARAAVFSSSADHDGIGVATLAGLSPGESYEYEVDISECRAAEVGTFRTLPTHGEPVRVRFAMAGDVEGSDVPGFDDIAAVKPDFVLMVGDNVYADGFGMNHDAYLARYLDVWQGVQFQKLFSRIPAFAIWDDHELVDNYWQGKNDTVFEFASALYDDFQGSRNPDPLVAGERYYSFEAGDVGFFVLDTRTHRSPNGDPDGPDKTMLGREQLEALLDWLRGDTRTVHVLVSSVLMSPFATTGQDSWAAFGVERDTILKAAAAARTPNLIVVSGDQHWSAVLRLDVPGAEPYTVYEFQSTPLAFSERGAPNVSSSAIVGLENEHRVFGVVDIDSESKPVLISYTLCVVGEPCDPHRESSPGSAVRAAAVPYSLHFEGGESGLILQD